MIDRLPRALAARCGLRRVVVVLRHADELAPAAAVNTATPAAGAAPGQLTVTVAVADIGALATCASPTVQARLIGLRFTGLTDDVRIELPNDIALQKCSAQVRLHGYGPAKP